MSSHHRKIRVGISIGDINGIGPEIILKTFLDTRMIDQCTAIIYGSSYVFSYYRKALALQDISFNIISTPKELNHKRFNLINCWSEDVKIDMGESTEIAGKCSYDALERAVVDLKEGSIDVLVTAPINKHNIQSAGFKFPGHTEYLERRFEKNNVIMLMIHEQLRIGVVTGHIPVKDVASTITSDLILDKLTVFKESLIRDFRIEKPRIAVLGLNPHAGDNGVIGDEEKNIIIPAIELAKKQNILAFGPYPADGFFGSQEYKKFDGILAMYHDQGLIPFKSIASGNGVNFTAGLPIVRTSPAHGTGYDITGKNMANETSFREAIFLACDIFRIQEEFVELKSNPLKITKLRREREG